jgi:hypothetical protein
MKKLIIALLVTMFAGTALAADVPLSWDPVDGAVGYKVYASTDTGTTWTEIADVAATSVTLTGEPDSGLILYRVSAYDANQEAVRTYSGAWYNGDWMPLGDPGGTGIE